jgi:hypothetical protein
MPDWVFRTAFLLAASFMTFNGVFMLIAPAKHRRFLAWVSRANSWSQPGEQHQLGLEIERRLAGIGLAGMGIFLAWSMFRDATHGKAETSPLPNLGTVWFPLFLGLSIFALGAFVILLPGVIVQCSIKHQPTSREISRPTLDRWRMGARLLGAGFLMGGLYTLWVALMRQ